MSVEKAREVSEHSEFQVEVENIKSSPGEIAEHYFHPAHTVLLKLVLKPNCLPQSATVLYNDAISTSPGYRGLGGCRGLGGSFDAVSALRVQ